MRDSRVRPVRHVRLLLALAAFVALAGVDAAASCPQVNPGPPCAEFWRADAVFVGTATQVILTPNTTGLAIGPYSKSTVYFSVEEAFRGVEDSSLTMEMDYCGYRFKQGERYFVYAFRDRNTGALRVRHGVTRTRPLVEAAEDLEYARALPASARGSRVFGRVFVYTHDLRAGRYAEEPLKGVKVWLEGDGRREAATDDEGRYEFAGLPAGTYTVRAEFPGRFDAGEPPPTLKAAGRECFAVNLSARRRGRVAGRLLDAEGRPVVYAPISLVAADAPAEEILSADHAAWSFSLTDERGRFDFSGLAPGRYLLVVNRADGRRLPNGDDIKLPRLFYPGVPDITQAAVLTVGERRPEREYEFRLPPR